MKRVRGFVAATATFVFFCSAAAPAADKPPRAAIASAHTLATQAGFEVLAAGGNAFDAAVAVAAALSVVEPQSSGIGGGGLFLLHRASDGKEVMVDARETAPAAVDSKFYLDANGEPDRDHSTNGPLSAAIPGEPAGLVWLARHYGKLPLTKSLAPAIRLAREGFQPDGRFLKELAARKEVIARYPGSAALYLVDGEAPKAGWTFKSPDLARVLERIAEHGNDGFYRGELAKTLVDGVRAAGGNWTLDDLAKYEVKERAPLAFDYRGWRIVTAPPPSSGGIALAEMLNVLGGYELSKLDRVHRVHLTVEAMRRAYRDRAEYLGDPDFVEMPIARLMSADYAAGLRASIHPEKATPSELLPPYLAPPQGTHTTHFSIIDRDGNLVSATQTVNLIFGSGFVVPGTGFVLNDEMDDFALVAGKPNAFGLLGNERNAPRPGSRPLSSMTPSFVIGADKVGVIGTPGGSRIITMVLEGILAFVDGESPEKFVGNPRYHHQYMPDVISAEKDAFTPDEVKALEAMGHKVNESERRWGFMNAVSWDKKTGAVQAGSDPRGDSGSGLVKP
ncbi:gamma-glutamyltransferase [Dokdonella sp.]|uniref:gamma-glutamyltransferase n=1 Tax=Dokdonella sp. TaxID=2291710 RepID=UPI001B0ABA2A|nr:gamma-glutamyltransferase [Dokdonella sp.]MBO9664930.1 gamma-glutamyltransferase [Dokdonella sp.]